MNELKYRDKNEMNDSRIQWLGMVPNNWVVKRVKHAFIKKNKKAKLKNPVILSLARSGIKIRNIDGNEGQIAESYYNYNPVSKGDLLLNPMDLVSGANCNMSSIEGVISPAYFNLGSKPLHSPKFYDYYFKLQYWSMAFFAHGKGVSYENRWTLNNETLMNYIIPYTDYIEQQKITNFLNIKTAQFDNIIAKKERLIKKLDEAKKSLIFEVVTGKVKIQEGKLVERDSFEMKNSDVEWLGMIPINWSMKKAKHVSNVFVPQRDKPNLNINGEGYRWITVECIGDKYLRTGKELYVGHKDFRLTGTRKLKANSVITSCVGQFGLTSINQEEVVINQQLQAFVDINISVDFMNYYVSLIGPYFESISTETTLKYVNKDKFLNIDICIPSNDEQSICNAYLDMKILELSNVIEKTKEQLQKFEQAKQSLISEAVTGKIDLRDWEIIEEGELQ